jgi:XapX domain-containing protein
MRFTIGLIVSFAIGVSCRLFDVPVGSPAAIPGALIVLAMTAGCSWTNQFLNARKRPSATTHLCGGPTGRSVASETTGAMHDCPQQAH